MEVSSKNKRSSSSSIVDNSRGGSKDDEIGFETAAAAESGSGNGYGHPVDEDEGEFVDDEDVDHRNNQNGYTSVETTDDDIYGDLESAIFTCRKSKTVNEKEWEEKLKIALEENVKLKQDVRKLSKENKAYATNISSLYLTAKTEIEKKNFIIKQLQTKLTDLTTVKARNVPMSKQQIEDILKECHVANQEAHSQLVLEEIKKAMEQMKTAKLKPTTDRKMFKFGKNMSLYLCREQVPFKRLELVEFPDLPLRTEMKSSTFTPSTDISTISACTEPTPTHPPIPVHQTVISSAISTCSEPNSTHPSLSIHQTKVSSAISTCPNPKPSHSTPSTQETRQPVISPAARILSFMEKALRTVEQETTKDVSCSSNSSIHDSESQPSEPKSNTQHNHHHHPEKDTNRNSRSTSKRSAADDRSHDFKDKNRRLHEDKDRSSNHLSSSHSREMRNDRRSDRQVIRNVSRSRSRSAPRRYTRSGFDRRLPSGRRKYS